MACVDRVSDRLSNEVVADGVELQAVPSEELATALTVAVFGERTGDVEVVAPAGELQPIESELARLAGHVFERKVGPLASEQRDGARHGQRLRSTG